MTCNGSISIERETCPLGLALLKTLDNKFWIWPLVLALAVIIWLYLPLVFPQVCLMCRECDHVVGAVLGQVHVGYTCLIARAKDDHWLHRSLISSRWVINHFHRSDIGGRPNTSPGYLWNSESNVRWSASAALNTVSAPVYGAEHRIFGVEEIEST